MMHVLRKVSSPGWVKNFDSEGQAAAELLTHICGECLKGELAMVGTDDKHRFPPPDQSSISGLLGTPCGCEYQYETEN